MVSLNDLVGLGIVIIGSSLLLNQRKTYSLKSLPISSPEEFYKPRLDFNLSSIAAIENAQTRLTVLGKRIKDITLDQEKQKRDYQVNYLETQKRQAGALLSQLQKIERLGSMFQSFSPRIRGLTLRKKGYDPVDQQAIERGKKASQEILKIDQLKKSYDQGILKAQKQYSNLETL